MDIMNDNMTKDLNKTMKGIMEIVGLENVEREAVKIIIIGRIITKNIMAKNMKVI